MAASVVEQFKQYGEVRRGWLGAKTAVVTSEIAQSAGLGEKRGALLEAITPGAPAATADLKSGDIVLAIDDQPVKDNREFARRIGEFPPEAEVRLRVWRDRGERDVVVRLGQIPKRGASAPEGKGLKLNARLGAVPGGETGYRGSLGIFAQDVDGALAKALDLAEPAGALVLVITPGSAAQAAGLLPGDVILSVNARKMLSFKDVHHAIRELHPGSEVSLDVWRIGDGAEDFKRTLQARAESGDIPAITALAELHHTGGVVSKDLREAARLYLKAAEAGDAEAMKYLGGMYEEGSGVEKNVVEAARLYLKAAEAGDAEAMGLYGVKYLYGNGVPQSDAEAVKWLQRGAGDGDARSMRNLARMYDQGRGLGQRPRRSGAPDA
ncbi:MAG: PDZ domain-containing protein [Hyphomicrobium sp.]|nr:PDZ domain-containing protein [Hyphomicrobium sp.]